MDEEKKKKLIMIVFAAIVALILSIIACVLGISPDTLRSIIVALGADNMAAVI